VSARHQVKRLDRPFEELENRFGRRNQFSSFGADPLAPQFHRRSQAQVKSGPDVFADALVPSTAAMTPGALISPNSLCEVAAVASRNAFTPDDRALRRRTPSGASNGRQEQVFNRSAGLQVFNPAPAMECKGAQMVKARLARGLVSCYSL